MALVPVGPGIKSQELNDNFSYLESNFTAYKEDMAKEISPVFNVQGYGAVGDGKTDDTSSIQKAINAAAKVGGTVWLPFGIYRIIASLILLSRIRLYGDPGTIIDASALENNDNAIEAIGTSGTPVLLSVNALENKDQITVVSAVGFKVGDWVMVLSEAITGSTNQPKGEIGRIVSVSGTIITLQDPLCDTYNISDGAAVKKLTMKEDISIEGLTIIGNSDPNIGISGLMFDTCQNIRVEGVTVMSVGYTGINLRDTVHFRIYGCHFEDITKIGYAYGMAFAWACQDGTVSNCTGMRMRHLIATGGGTGRAGVPRRIASSNCTASQMMDAGFDCHPGAEDIIYNNCHVIGSEGDGFTIQAASFQLIGCTVRNIARHGYLVEHASDRHLDAIISSCRGHNIGQQGVSIVFYNAYNNYRGLTIEGVNIFSCGTNGISMGQVLASRAKNITIANCRVHSPGVYAYNFRNVEDLTLIGNQAKGISAGNRGVNLFDIVDGVIQGNITDGGNIGYQIESCTDIQVVGNRAKGATFGFNVASTSHSVFQGNNARGCATPFAYGSGTGNIYQTAAGDKYNRD